jgi:hypothetical protein
MDDFDDLSYSFYTDNRVGYIDSEDNIVNNCKNPVNEKIKKVEYINSPPDPIAVITQRSKERWTEDSAVNNCQSCNATFRVYRRRHHCIAEGTPVTLSDGTAKNIEYICANSYLPSYNSVFDCIQNNKTVDTLFDQGYEPCYKLVLEDGREIVATSDHEFLIESKETVDSPKYVKLQDLKVEDRIICSAFVGIYNNSNETDEKLAQARLSGFFNSGELEDLKGDDLEALKRDLALLGDRFQKGEVCQSLACKREYIAAFFGNRKLKIQINGYKNQCEKILEAEEINNWLNQLGVASTLEINYTDDTYIFDYRMSLKSFAEKIGIRYSLQKSIDLHLLLLKDNIAFTENDNFLKYIHYDEEKRYYSLKISSLQSCGVQHVYDLSVPGNVSFVAGGVVVHNCRACVGIYCDSCSSYRARIPKVVKKIPTKTGKEEPIDYNTEVRLCLKCYNSYTEIHKLEKLFTIFSLLRLNLYDFKIIACVSKQWNLISAFYMSKFREIQYKLPKSNYNSWEKQALWTNRYLLKYHSIWETHVLRSCESEKFVQAVEIYFPNTNLTNQKEQNEESGEMKRIPSYHGRQCWNRMCSRYCRPCLDPERALLLLDVLEKKGEGIQKAIDNVAEKIAKTFDNCTDSILECYLPFILHKTVLTNNEVLKTFIFQRCSKNIRIANISYWYLKMNSKTILSQMVGCLSQDTYTRIIKTQSFTEMVSNGEKLRGKMISVVCPEMDEQEIYTDKIAIKESATRPTLIPCSGGSILYKKDDVRKDYIIMCVIRLMEKILKDNGLDIDIVTYNVQPTSEGEGFIQIVENCETLYNISEKLKISLTNYLLNNNPNESVSNLRQRFKNSCAFFSTVAYLLSLSDRNSDNLMLTERGDFFEIDFSYCLGSDPKPLRTSCIRITHQMLETLGGESSKEYLEFKELCGKIYDILRRHVNTFVCLLSLIPTFKSTSYTSPNINEEQMMIEIIKRFCPGETYDAAISNLKTRIDNSADNSTLTKYHVIDFFHKMNKEKTVTNYLNYGYTGGKAMLSSMYLYLYSFT